MTPAFRFDRGVTLVGGGAGDPAAFAEALALAPHVVAADAGADAVEVWGGRPDAVIGDMDSAMMADHWRDRGVPVLRLPEQETTDLEKCLYSVAAPFFVGVGFTGRRFDHTLAALHAMLRWRKPLALIGEEDVVFLCPTDWRARLAPGARVSFFPLAPVVGIASEGLRWPIDGLRFAPGERIGTSNAAAGEAVRARFDGPGMACMIERRHLAEAVRSLTG